MMRRAMVVAAALNVAAFGLQACVSASSTITSQPPQYSENLAGRTVCDADGTNCRPCDANTANCSAAATKKYWGFLF
jgi:hypothetical protein